MQRAEKIIEIDAPLERVFDIFSDFESFPRWMRNIKDVRYTGRRFSRWVADAPLGTSVEWEAETTVFEPDHHIVWRSVRGDVYTEGEVIFEETRRGTTLMRIVLGYEPPAGRLGAMVASLFGKNPEQQLEEDLERFAEVAERRRSVRDASRAEGERPRRPRQDGPADERRQYVRAQVERRRQEAYNDETGLSQRDERGGYDPRFRTREGQDERADEYRLRDDREGFDERGERNYREERFPVRGEHDSRGERHPRADFDEALREARRSQLESIRRYREETEREERARPRDNERRRGFNGGPDDEEEQRRAREDERATQRRRTGPITRGAEDARRSQPQTGHAMSPRERELERARRRPDNEYSSQAFRRGVDRLMDEPPSNHWRRWEREEE